MGQRIPRTSLFLTELSADLFHFIRVVFNFHSLSFYSIVVCADIRLRCIEQMKSDRKRMRNRRETNASVGWNASDVRHRLRVSLQRLFDAEFLAMPDAWLQKYFSLNNNFVSTHQQREIRSERSRWMRHVYLLSHSALSSTAFVHCLQVSIITWIEDGEIPIWWRKKHFLRAYFNLQSKGTSKWKAYN